MSPIVRAARTVKETVRHNKLIIGYIAIVVTIIAYMSIAARYYPNWP